MDRPRGEDRLTVAKRVNLSGLHDLLAGGQIRGARPYQEDDFRISAFPDGDPDGCDFLMVLADGMGGHRGGAEASRVAVTAFVEAFGVACGGVAARLRASLDSANEAVGTRAAADRRLRGMGCTLVGCVVTELEEAHWISVGDSPLWRAQADADTEGALARLNADHSLKPLYAELVRRGEATEEEARQGGHQLRSAVTGEALSLVDEGNSSRVAAGDLLILASDGMETLSEDRIRSHCDGRADVGGMVGGLLAEVEKLALPSQDNATVLIYRHMRRGAVQGRFDRLTAPTRPPSPRAIAGGKESA